MSGRKRKVLDVDAMKTEYLAGDGPKAIGARQGVSAQTVRNRLTAAGVQLRPHPGPVDLPMDRVAAEYERGDSLPVLGRRYDVPPETIRRRLLRHGVQIRDQAAGQRVRYGRHGDLAGLAGDLGITEDQAHELLLKHGFIYEERS